MILWTSPSPSSNVYGPYCLHKNSVIAKFIKDGILKRRLTIYGDGTQTRDFIHVNDICQAIYLCLSALGNGRLTNQRITNNGKVSGETFHLGSGKETPVLELAKLVQGLFNEGIKISFASERKGEIKRNYSDISRAKSILGFEPEVSLEDGVKEVYNWFNRQEVESLRKSEALSGSE